MEQDLVGMNSKTVIFNENTRFLHLHNISTSATFKVTHKKDGQSDIVAIPTISILDFLEADNKRRVLNGMNQSTIVLGVDSNDEPVIIDAVIDLIGFDAELTLDTNNTCVVTFSSLNSIAEDSFVKNIEGRSDVSADVRKFIKHTYDKRDDNKKVNLLTSSFIAFKKSQLPESLEFVTQGKVQRLDSTYLTAVNSEIFGPVVFNSDTDQLTFGTYNMVVIPVSNATSCTVIDELQTSDFDFYTF